jgi:hypothetical protein
MEREEAKNILQLCRPGNEADLNDPLIAEALELLDTDDELRAWFDEQQAFDARITSGIDAIEPPVDLKAAILAGMRAHKAAASIAFPMPEVKPRIWWQNPWVGIAALFIVMMVIVVPRSEETQLAQNNTALSGIPPVVQFISEQLDGLKAWQFDKRDKSASELQTFLASTGSPSPTSIPGKLHDMPTIGCVTFDYNSTKLSMICFKNGAVYHLITAKKADYPDRLPAEPQVFELHDKAFKLWIEGDQVKILTVHGTKQDIPEFI